MDLIAQGKLDRMVAWHDRSVIDVLLASVVAGSRPMDPRGSLVYTTRSLGIYMGGE